MRFLSDSNWRERFCRPVPNHSAKEPLVLICVCKVNALLPILQISMPFFLLFFRFIAFLVDCVEYIKSACCISASAFVEYIGIGAVIPCSKRVLHDEKRQLAPRRIWCLASQPPRLLIDAYRIFPRCHLLGHQFP